MAKGATFEREICGLLSSWWTNGKSDSEFWRTSMSGGRATVRGRKGKATTGHAGDICATGKRGLGLMKRITFELKRGYNKTANLHNLLDLRPGADSEQEYEKWINQATEAAVRAKTEWWCIIHRRDGRQAIIILPFRLWKRLGVIDPVPFVRMGVMCRRGKVRKMKSRFLGVVMMRLPDFLAAVPPEAVRGL